MFEHSTPLSSLREGDLLGGRYRIESRVRDHASGAQFQATDLTRGTRVSAHVLVASPGSSGSPSFLAGAVRAQALRGPHVTRVLDAGVTPNGHPWIIREHVASPTLSAHLRDHGALTTAEAVDVTLAVCDAIAEAHANSIVHGSLGPHAIHVAWSASGLADIKVTGAGTAAAETALLLGSTRAVESIPRAPEQLTYGARIDGRADVWAIGALLRMMLASGCARSGAPEALAEVIRSALATDPEKRPRTVLDLADALVCFGSHPDFAQDRISARRPARACPPAPDSAPTLAIQRPVSTHDALVELSPSVRELPVVPAPWPRTRKPLAPFATPPRRRMSRDNPTYVTPKSTSFPRRRALKVLGLIAAAASVALLVLIGTEGSRLSRGAWLEPATPIAAAAPAPAAVELPAAATTTPPIETATTPPVSGEPPVPASAAPRRAHPGE